MSGLGGCSENKMMERPCDAGLSESMLTQA